MPLLEKQSDLSISISFYQTISRIGVLSPHVRHYNLQNDNQNQYIGNHSANLQSPVFIPSNFTAEMPKCFSKHLPSIQTSKRQSIKDSEKQIKPCTPEQQMNNTPVSKEWSSKNCRIRYVSYNKAQNICTHH